MNLEEELIALERRLLEPDVRTSAQELDRLLADDFLEIGASGIRFGKKEALDRLPRETAPEFHVVDFELRSLGPELAQLVYRATMKKPGDAERRYSLRCSLWKKNGSRWQMVYHQGTPCPPL